jgi:hypothetical protein
MSKWPQPLGLLSIATATTAKIPGLDIKLLYYDSHLNMDDEGDLAAFGNTEIVGMVKKLPLFVVNKGIFYVFLVKSLEIWYNAFNTLKIR